MLQRIRCFCFAYFVMFSVLGLTSPASVAQQRPVILEEVAKILPPGPDDQLTVDAAISGDDLLVSWRRNFDSPQGFWSDQVAYMYRRSSDGTWRRLTTLGTMSSPHLGARTIAMAMRGDIAAVNADELMIFERTSSGWQRTAQLGSSEILDLEIDGAVILGSLLGCGWQTIRKSTDGWRIFATVPSTRECNPGTFASDTDISGSTVVMSNPYYGLPPDISWPHRVRIYTGYSSRPTFVTDPFDNGVSSAIFGIPVAVDRTTLYGGRAGQVLAFERGSDGVWRHRETLEPPDAFALDNGTALQAAGSLIAAGHPEDASRSTGSVRLFQRESSGAYREAARLFIKGISGDNQLGSEVDIEGRRVVASALRAAYVFELPETLKAPGLFQDLFEDGNANGWTASGNTWSIARVGDLNVYRQRDVHASNARSIRTGLLWANQSVEADVSPTQFMANDSWFGVITRYTNESNYYSLSVHNTNTVRLQRNRRGIVTTLDSAPLSVGVNRPYRLRIEAIGTRIRGYVDGELLVEAVDGALRDGRPGLITHRATADFDTVIASPTPLTTLFADNFNGQFVNSHWQVVSGLWDHIVEFDPQTQQTLGRYVQTMTQGHARVLGGVSTRDQVVEADTSSDQLAQGVWYGLTARYVSDGNFYCLCVRQNNRISLQKFTNGTVVGLDSTTLEIRPNTWHRLRLEVMDQTLRGYVDDRLVLQAWDVAHVSGRYGLATFGTAAQFDNFHANQP